MSEYFYIFKVNGENRGYSYLRLDQKRLLSYTRFLMENDEIYTNVFVLKLNGERVLACKHGLADWVDFSDQPHHHYPSCAYPLLLTRVASQPYTYMQISEDDGAAIGETTLWRDGADLVETRNAKEYRRFTMRNGIPIKINWGGAISILCKSAEEATEGSSIEFVRDEVEKWWWS